MNIIYVAGESSDFVLNLCNKFCEKGHNVTCVVQNEDSYDRDEPVVEHKNLTRIDVSYSVLFSGKGLVEQLKDVISNTKTDIIFGSHAPMAPLIQYLANLYKIPWGIMILDIPSDLMYAQRKRMKQWLLWFDTMKMADAIIFNTNIARDEYDRFTGQWFNEAYVIPYAINTPEKFDMSGVDIKGDYVISVCRLTYQKNCSIIPKALSLLNMPKKYIAIGKVSHPPELEEIKKICKENDIEFEHHEMITETKKFELIRDSAMVIYPQESEYIGGLNPFEGMFCGKSVIANDYKVLRDLYTDYAIYFNNTPEDLATKIAYVYNKKITTPRHNLKMELARRWVDETATFDKMAEGMLNIFEKIRRK